LDFPNKNGFSKHRAAKSPKFFFTTVKFYTTCGIIIQSFTTTSYQNVVFSGVSPEIIEIERVEDKK